MVQSQGRIIQARFGTACRPKRQGPSVRWADSPVKKNPHQHCAHPETLMQSWGLLCRCVRNKSSSSGRPLAFRIDLTVDRHASLVSAFQDRDLATMRQRCLNPASLGFSQRVGEYLLKRGVQAILYASVTGAGSNVVVFV